MTSISKRMVFGLAIVILLVGSALAWYLFQPPTSQTGVVTLNGAGATFPFPLVSKMSREYLKVNPNVQVNYQSIGSGGGIRQHTVKTVDFGVSDIPLTDSQLMVASNTLHIPFSIGAVVPMYNIPEASTGLKFTGELLADIFLGKVMRWNDRRVTDLNPGLNLPAKEVVVVHRSDGSGTTYVWTNYLSNISSEWAAKVGKSTSVNWPMGLGGKGNEGVAGLISQNPYSIGYGEFAYAVLNNIKYGYVRNAAGNYVEPKLETFAAASAAAALRLPKGDQSWSKVSIIDEVVKDSKAQEAYPITSFSYFLAYREVNVLPGMNENRAKALVNFLWWAVHDGQKYATDLVYVPLPSEVVKHNEETLGMITFNGQQVMRN